MHRGFMPPGADPHNPRVSVFGSQITVGPDPLPIPKGDSAAIVWHLHTDGNYTFPDNGITVASDEFQCRRENDKTFTCQNRHTKAGHYKYTIRVLDGGKPLEPLDPFIYNE